MSRGISFIFGEFPNFPGGIQSHTPSHHRLIEPPESVGVYVAANPGGDVSYLVQNPGES
jgi:hypothetical protein